MINNQPSILAVLDEHLPQMAADLATLVIAENLESYAAFPREQLVQMVSAALQAVFDDLRAEQPQHFSAYWNRIAVARAEQDTRVVDLLQALILSERVLTRFVQEQFPDDDKQVIAWLIRLHEVVYSGVRSLSQVFVEVRERIIQQQGLRIRELSTPIIPLYSGVLVLPLVGAMDSYRAGQIMEALLEGISAQQAEVVIIDITGVPVVDTAVANHLLQSARAARLLGATVVLVGIGAEIAQTIVQLGLDLSDIVTRANLQAGIEYALALQGVAIQPMR